MKAARPATLYEVAQDARVCLRLTRLQKGILSAIRASPWGCASRADLSAILRHPRTGGLYGSGVGHAIADLRHFGLIRHVPSDDERVNYLA